MAQSVKCTTSAQVTISRFVGSSPASGSVLTAQSLEPASDSVSPSLSAPPLLVFFFIFFKFIFERERERERESQWERGREGDTASEAGSRLRAVSTEPDAGLEPTNREIVT